MTGPNRSVAAVLDSIRDGRALRVPRPSEARIEDVHLVDAALKRPHQLGDELGIALTLHTEGASMRCWLPFAELEALLRKCEEFADHKTEPQRIRVLELSQPRAGK